MSAVHEPGEVWHIGWDWFAHMWYVEPPFDVELDEPIKWFNERGQAFNFVDDWIRSQPVQASVIDQMDTGPAETIALPDEGTDLAVQYVPPRVEVPEPVRQMVAPVHIPSLEEAQTKQEARLAEYAQRVGIK
jgi:hypothetical protein